PLAIAAPGLLANDTDIDSPVLTAVKTSNPSHGTVVVNADGSFIYTPAANYNGPDSFTYRARDAAAGSAPTTVSLTVTPVNDAPVAQQASYTTPINRSFSGRLIATDVEGDPLTYRITALPTKGAIVLDPATGIFTYTPFPGRSGGDSFKF